MCYACLAIGTTASWSSFDHADDPAQDMVPEAAVAGGSVSATGNRNIDGLLSGYRWSGPITYSFPDATADYESGYTEAGNGFRSVSFHQMQAARSILEGVSAVSGGPRMGLTAFEQFTNASIADAGSNGADIRIAGSNSANPTAYAYYPVGDVRAGDVWFGNQYDYGAAAVGNYQYQTMIHELGHALGLKHGQSAGGPANVALSTDRDSMEFSVMTYRSYIGAPLTGYTNESFGYAQTFMMQDIAALQHMYGADFTTNGGNTVYRWDPATGQASVDGVGQGTPGANRVFLTVWDGGGNDTYDFSNYGGNLAIDLAPGGWSLVSTTQRAYLGGGSHARGNVFNALQHQGDARSLIENAIGGAGADVIAGNAAANNLSGNGGNDTLQGGDGNDTLVGGVGADRLEGGGGVDLVSYADAGTGVTASLLLGSGSAGEAAGDSYLGIEDLVGSVFADHLVGDNDGNRLSGHAASDQLNGGGGRDTLEGGIGTDRLDGGVGADCLIGGAERDDFSFSYAESGSITALGGWDWIGDFEDGLDLLSFDLAFAVEGGLRYLQHGADLLISTDALGFSGGVIVANATQAQVLDQILLPDAPLTEPSATDFLGDGSSDLLWHHDDGSLAFWDMNGAAVQSGKGLPSVDGSWQAVEKADFNNDGQADILWQRDDGTVALWELKEGVLQSGTALMGAGAGWSAKAAGDTGGDGRADIVLQHDDGRVVLWEMDGGEVVAGAQLLGAGTGWSVDAMGDLSGDGRQDIFFRHLDGSICVWEMNGTAVLGGRLLASVPGWEITDTFDFNQDGRSDAVLQHQDGRAAVWTFNAAGEIGASATLLGAGSGWTIEEAGDFRNDGTGDIMVRHTDGSLVLWDMQGVQVGGGELVTQLSTDWHLA